MSEGMDGECTDPSVATGGSSTKPEGQGADESNKRERPAAATAPGGTKPEDELTQTQKKPKIDDHSRNVVRRQDGNVFTRPVWCVSPRDTPPPTVNG